jgi:hypothetical protein
MAARIPSKTGIVTLPLDIFLWRIIGEGSLQNKGVRGMRKNKCLSYCDRQVTSCLIRAHGTARRW